MAAREEFCLSVAADERRTRSGTKRQPSRPASAPGNGNGRVPPHSMQAEEALLGALLISRHAVTDVVGTGSVTASDFYKPAHGHIYGAICSLVAQERPVDALTVVEELSGAGMLEAIGGDWSVITSLMAGTPSLDNAASYARIVSERSVLRQALGVAGEISEAAYGGDMAGVERWLAEGADRLQFGRADAGTWALVDLAAVMDGLEPEQPTLLARDDGVQLLYPGRVHAFNAASESGKAQPLDAKVLSPSGWRAMGELHIGDQVIGSDGRPTAVTGVFPQGELAIYRITFSDGVSVEASGDHLWRVLDQSHRHRGQPGMVLTTDQIAERLMSHVPHRRRMYIPMAGPTQYETGPVLPIDPYVLGLLLGDGGLTKGITFTSNDDQLFDELAARLPPDVSVMRGPDRRCAGVTTPSGRPNPVLAAIRALGLFGHKSESKFIPPDYLTASIDARLELLRGLMDTDGSVEGSGTVFSTSSPQLATDARALIESLGGTASTTSKIPTYRHRGELREGLRAYRLWVRLPAGVEPFRLARKIEVWRRWRVIGHQPPVRAIREVTYVGEKDAQCITVAAENQLYVTEHHIVTHNSWAALLACKQEMDLGGHVLYVDFEDSAAGVVGRLVAMGVRRADVVERFHYVRPDDPITDSAKAAVMAMTRALTPNIAVLDGVTEAMSLSGWSIKENDDIALFFAALARPIARMGTTVILIDHVVKDRDARGNDAIGGQHKRAGIDGASYMFDVVKPFGRGMAGLSRVTVTKDRHGAVRQVARAGTTIGELHVIGVADGKVSVGLRAPMTADSDGKINRPTVYMERVSRAVEDANTAGVKPSVRKVTELVHGKRDHIIEALKLLCLERHVTITTGPRKTIAHVIAKPYRQIDDPLSTEYQGPVAGPFDPHANEEF